MGSHEKLYGRKLYHGERRYLLEGPFWDGFRNGARWVTPFYILFFSYLVYVGDTTVLKLCAVLLCVLSGVASYLAWRKQ